MTATPTVAKRPALALRILFAIPFFGRILRDISDSVDNVFYALMILVTGLVLAVNLFGVVALTMVALFLVPVMFVLLILITRG
jgi:purine-cytosine permease-like protein